MKNKEDRLKFLEEHLFYELRMLFGASKLVALFDKYDMGNAASLYRDSVYLHTRNLYNFFWGVAKNDVSIYEYINHVFDVALYLKWTNPLHAYVIHIQDKRNKSSREIDGKTIDQMVLEFKKDIESLWIKWIEVEKDPKVKEILICKLAQAIQEANNDYRNTRSKIMKTKNGIDMPKEDLKQLHQWTIDDIDKFTKTIDLLKQSGPSSSIAILLVCYMDIWGSIAKNDFGGTNSREHVGVFLKKLKEMNGNDYLFSKNEQDKLGDILRNNLVHNFGRRTIANGNTEELLNIDIRADGPVINKEDDSGRWHINCYKLMHDVKKIITIIFNEK